ncbi:MAG: amino acid adenylation domain-containing protein [Chloroflexota bacterium]
MLIQQDQAITPAGATPAAAIDIDLYDPLYARFERQARRAPQRLAVQSVHETLTYAALNEKANRLAHALLRLRGDVNEPVPYLLDREDGPVTAILGILKAGKAYVCVEPSYPPARLRAYLADTQAGVVVTNRRYLALAREVAGERAILDLDDLDASLPVENPGLLVSPESLAVIFYTSGSTGEPKGVVHNHKTLLVRALTSAEPYRIDDSSRFASPFSTGHVMSTSTMFCLLTLGGCHYPYQLPRLGVASLAAWFAAEGITHAQLTPSVLRLLLETLPEDASALPKLRLMHVAGEPLFPRDVEQWRAKINPQARLSCIYGSTESLQSTRQILDRNTKTEGECVSIGRAVPGHEVFLVDENGQRLGAGLVGEIVLRSAFVSPGYWRRPDLSAPVFRPDPDDPDKQIYFTGDLGRLRPDGNLEHLGRDDAQVKIRGFRVQLGEVESTLFATGLAKEAVVAVRADSRGEPRLVAYLVPAAERKPTVFELRALLAHNLPEYMLPSAFVYLDSMPLNANGKVDRLHLPEPPSTRPDLATAYQLPRDAVELRLVELWEQVLGIRGVGVEDDFFALGGHSLLAADLALRIEAEYGVRLPVSTLFTSPTVAHIARLVRREGALPPWVSLATVQAGQDRPPLFWLHGVNGGPFWYRALLPYLDLQQPLLAVSAAGFDGRAPIYPTVEAMAAHYVREIRQFQPQGPYYLAGPSAAGAWAYEVARQLRAAGQQVALLALFDSPMHQASPAAPIHPPGDDRHWLRGFIKLGRHGTPIYLRALARQLYDHYLRPSQPLVPARLRAWLEWARLYPRWLAHDLRRRAPGGSPQGPGLTALVQAVSTLAFQRYRPRPCEMPAILFLAGELSGYSNWALPARWRQLVGPELEVVRGSGEHQDLLAEPQVRSVAARLQARLPRD